MTIPRIYVLDFHVLAHRANEARKKKGKQPRGWLGSWLRANIVAMTDLAWDPAKDSKPVAFVAVSDTKPYWRGVELRKPQPGFPKGIAYKFGRKKRSRQGLSYTKSLMTKLFLELGIPVLASPGQEADDMAAALVRLKPKDVFVRLVTVDNDWLGLIRTPGTDWVCMHGYAPRYRGTLADIQKSKQGRESGIKDLADFYSLKQAIGDKGDTLPEHCPRWAVDLYNPLPQYDAAVLCQKDIQRVYASIDRLVHNTKVLQSQSREAHKWLALNQAPTLIT